MKKIISILFTITLISISVTACGNKSKSTVIITRQPVTEAPIIDKQLIDMTNSNVILALNSFKTVLKNNSVFFNTDQNKYMNISQLVSSLGTKMKISKFAIIDLDHDTLPEVVLSISADGDDYYFVILRYQDERVYGYVLPLRAFYPLKIDGTFTFSSGAADSGFGTITFTENNYSIDQITYSESHPDSNFNMNISYFVDHKSATKEEFDNAISRQIDKPDVTWYEYSEDLHS